MIYIYIMEIIKLKISFTGFSTYQQVIFVEMLIMLLTTFKIKILNIIIFYIILRI